MQLCRRHYLVFASVFAFGCGEVQSSSDAGERPDASEFADAGVTPEPDAGDEVDIDPPDTSITAMPSDPSSDLTAEFEFTSTEAGSTFFCRSGRAGFTNCTSPMTVTIAGDGPQEFAVYAVDASDNADPTPAMFAWIVDTTPPNVTVSRGPASPTSDTTATFEFSANEGGVIRCRIDSDVYVACTSPKSFAMVSDGDHLFEVSVTDAAGNVGMGSYSWTVDASAPSIVITSFPNHPTNSTSANFVFNPEAGTTVQCAIDNGAFGPCDSRTTMSYTGLTPNTNHRFYVEVTDAAMNSATVSYTWTIDSAAPVVSILNTPNNPTNATNATFSFSVNETAAVLCGLNGATPGSCDTATTMAYATVPANQSNTFLVEATDEAGNMGSATFSWTVDTTPPVTRIRTAPADPWPVDYVTFTFDSNDTGATYQCRVDSGAYAACTSPKSYSNLGYIAHTFEVRAVDALNNVDATPAVARWTSAQGLVLHFPFDGSLKNVSPLGALHDGSGTAFTYIPGKTRLGGDEAVAFQGDASSVVKIPDTISPLTSDKSYTIAMWMMDTKPVTDPTQRMLFDFTGAAGGLTAYRRSSFKDELFVDFVTDAGNRGAGAVTVSANQVWVHVIFEYAGPGAGIDVYINDVLQGSIANRGGDVFSGGQLESLLLGNNSLFGIDDLRIYNRVFNRQEKCERIMLGTWNSLRGGFCS